MAEETAAPQHEAPVAETRSEDSHGATGPTFLGMLETLGRGTVTLLARPRIRTVLVGILLIIIGAFAINHSVWTFPIVIVGIVMVIVAWVGSRLEGRFSVEWSDAGAGFEMRARFKAADTKPIPGGLPTPFPASATVSETPIITPTVVTPTVPAHSPVDAETIEGEAHTVEIDAEELRALVAAAEKLARETATTHDTPVSWQENRAA